MTIHPNKLARLFFGVERENLEILLTLVRDSYPIANKANLFLESHTKKVYIAGN